MTIGKEVIAHFEQLFAEIQGTLEAFPEELWNRQDPQADWSEDAAIAAPRFLAHHTIWCLCLGHLLRIDHKRLPHHRWPDYGPDKPLDKGDLLALLDEIRQYARQIYAPMDDQTYLTADAKGQTPLGRMMYALAHTRHHYGQLVEILRGGGIEPPMWYPLRG